MITTHAISLADLHGILHSYRQFSALYGDRLANHLPMAVTALWRMGGDEEEIDRFALNYVKRLELRLGRVDSCNHDDDLPKLGSRDFENDSMFFAAQLETSSVDDVLGVWIPRLLPGLSASAFHGLIRTAYAVESGCRSEIGDALGFWSSEYTDFSIPLIEQDVSLQDVIGNVIAHFSNREYSGIIVDKMVAVSRDEFFSNGMVLPKNLTLDAIRRVVLDLYSQCEEFTLLHTVTSTHAMRVLWRFVANQKLACEILWQGLLLAIATVSNVFARNAQSLVNDLPKADWAEILRRGRQNLDDHTIKLIYTALEESRVADEERYNWIAARKVGIAKA